MYYYPFNVGDYLSHTAHLTEIEDLAYRRLLDWCYLHETGLPDNVEQVARLIRMRTHSACIATVLQEFFVLSEGTWSQQRISDEIAKYHSKGEKAAASAAKRWNKGDGQGLPIQPTKPKPSPDADAMRTHSERNAKQNHKQEPETINNTNSAPAGAVAECVPFDYFWQLYPKRQGIEAAKKVWLKMQVDESLFALIKTHLATAYLQTEVRYVPSPYNYLSQKRWLDEVLPNLPTLTTKPTKPAADDFVARHTDRTWALSFMDKEKLQ